MKKLGKSLAKLRGGMIALLGAGVVATAAWAAGITSGFPVVGVAVPTYSQITANGLSTVDTNLPGGQAPQTIAATPFQIAAIFAEANGNAATSTAGAATLNTRGGVITTEALATAVGATYSFALTDSLITTSTQLQVAMYSKTNTGGVVQVTSITPAAGSATIVFTNVGTSALNGTMTIVFHI